MAERNSKNGTRSTEQQRDEEKTPFEQFDDLMTKLLAVPKEELDEQRAEYEREKKGKRAG